MKIAFVAEHFNPRRGGAEIYMANFANYLVTKGHEVHFYIMSESVEGYPQFHLHRLRGRGLAKFSRAYAWLQFARRARADIRRCGDFDVVMGTGKCLTPDLYQPHSGVVAAVMRQNQRLAGPVLGLCKRIFNFFSPKHQMALWLEKRLLCDERTQVIAISEMVKKQMVEAYPQVESRISLVFNGVDTVRFHPATAEEKARARKLFGLEEDQCVFAIVGHNFRLKGVGELIKAAAKLHEVGLRFRVIVAGDGDIAAYSQMARRLGLEEVVRFLGRVQVPETVYAACDCYVQPTWYDPCSLVVLEALSCGLPAITTAFNGAGEVITDGEQGFVVASPDRIDELAAAMAVMLNRERARQMGAQARARVEHMSHEWNHSAMLALFEKVAAAKKK